MRKRRRKSESHFPEIKRDKTGVINDPLGQPTVPAGSDFRSTLKFCDGRTEEQAGVCMDGRTAPVKIVINTGRDCGRPRGSKYS